MSTNVSKTFRLKEDLQSLDELWESIAKLADGRLTDNAKGDDYPLELRMRQTAALRTYLECLEETHEHLANENRAVCEIVESTQSETYGLMHGVDGLHVRNTLT